jgi:hypothetical protein
MGAEEFRVKKVAGYRVVVVRAPRKSRVVEYICMQKIIVTFGICTIEIPKI